MNIEQSFEPDRQIAASRTPRPPVVDPKALAARRHDVLGRKTARAVSVLNAAVVRGRAQRRGSRA